jgi:hypothetical protein
VPIAISGALIGLQAAAAAASALVAALLAWLTIQRDRELRRIRNEEAIQRQLERIVAALASMRSVLLGDASPLDFDVAAAELATGLSARPADLPACVAVLAAPKPPYAMGDAEPWTRLERALSEARDHALALRADPQSETRWKRWTRIA